jgi:hypothetical protein
MMGRPTNSISVPNILNPSRTSRFWKGTVMSFYRKTLLPFVRNIDGLRLGFGQPIAHAIRATRAEHAPKDGKDSEQISSSSTPRTILAERALIHADIEQGARRGYVPADALIWRLYTNHHDELAEDHRRIDGLEAALDVHLRRLDTLYPVPSPPEPEQPTPAPPRIYMPIRDIWAKRGNATRH